MVSQIDLSEFFITKSQATDFIRSLDTIEDQMYEVNFNLEASLTKEFGIQKKDRFVELLRSLKMTNPSNEVLKELFVNIQDTVKNLSILSLTIAFEPDETTLKSFLQWFLFTLNKQIIIDIKVERDIIAGATVNFNGRFRDYSIKLLFDQIIKNKLYPQVDADKNTNQTNTKQQAEYMNIGR